MGYGLEVEMIRRAPASSTCSPRPTCSARANAVDMAEAGADIVVCHMGLTTGGAIGAETGADARGLRAAHRGMGGGRARRSNRDVIVLCHGGPIATPEPMRATSCAAARQCHGFYGASSMERLPTEHGAHRDHPSSSRRIRR